MQHAPRTAIGDVIQELGTRKVFVYPRHAHDPSVFSADEPLPTLRRMSVHKPSAGIPIPNHWTYGVKESEPDAAVVLTPELAAAGNGFPRHFFRIEPRQVCRWGRDRNWWLLWKWETNFLF